MDGSLLMLALIVGGCNWAFRFLPTKLDLSGQAPEGVLARFLAATGPAAIATLFVASVLPMVSGDWAKMAPLGAGVLAVVAVFAWRRSVVQATLAGAAVYGAVFALV
ncbi:AzlD domain-containing protein [Rhodobacter ferrooxidans]|uniref:Branched-chain amino acid transport n=1 Tax=Rhodobacter ferrooxidans TaxID=371731 RepID=C8S029_9RHOB|nr:AzlD domain-containing protein [Rhodobacter sp. SW2]EEW25638.1 conserved hypothetical protein [Rhodobacter sp. SW2]